MQVTIDPITLGIVWSSSIAITEEIGLAIRRSAYSTHVREGDDFSVALFDTSGQMVVQGTFSPGHLGSMPFMMKDILKYFPLETWRPGDAVIVNDPLIGSGHLNDIYATVPVFFEGQPVLFISAVCHHLDVGGVRPGSQAVEGVADLVAEGLRIMPTKLYREGKLNEDIYRLIADNVRQPTITMGDLQAQRNALQHHGVSRLVEMLNKYGLETTSACHKEFINRTELVMREAIKKIPDGTYSAEDYLDDYGSGTPPIKVKVTIKVRGSNIKADFAGSSSQVPAGLNSYINYTRSYVFLALKCLLAPKIPQNEGGIKPIEVTAPVGSFFNPKHGVPAGARGVDSHRITEVVMAALAPVIPERAVAAYGGFQHPTLGGIDPRSGSVFVATDLINAGHGARADKDGLEFMVGPFNNRNVPIEIYEMTYPFLVERYEVIPDSGGPGKNRGSVGLRRDTKYLADNVKYTNLHERVKFAPFGMFGGKSGTKGSTILIRNGKEEKIEGKGNYELKYGDVISVRLAGAGGWGDPFERDAQRVLDDVLEKYISIEGARREYGVVIDPETLTVDYGETERVRKAHKLRGKSKGDSNG